jgi:hypothetical protein
MSFGTSYFHQTGGDNLADTIVSAFFTLLLLALPPFTIFLSWKRWRKRRQIDAPKWRSRLLYDSLIGVSAHFVLLYLCVAYLILIDPKDTMHVFFLSFTFGMIVCPIIFILALLGKGPPRFMVAMTAVLGLAYWLFIAGNV